MHKYHRIHQKKRPKNVKIIAALMLCLLGFPSNFTGNAVKLNYKNDSIVDLLQASNEVAPSATNITNGDGNQAYEKNRDELNFSITGNFLIFTTLSFFVSNILLFLLLSLSSDLSKYLGGRKESCYYQLFCCFPTVSVSIFCRWPTKNILAETFWPQQTSADSGSSDIRISVFRDILGIY